MKKIIRNVGITIISLVLLMVILFYNVDLVRQNVELFLLKATGRMWALRGTLVAQKIRTDSIPAPRVVYVYTPPGYNPDDTKTTYPVLYLLHGYPDFGDMGWIKFGRAPQVIDELIVNHKIPPIIMVSPNGQGVGTLGDSEYIDAVNPATRKLPGAQMMEFVSEDLPHWVDAHYRTDATPSHRWLGGVSTGAYGAVNIALQHPLQFGTAISLSGYYTADDSGDARPVWGYHPTKQQLYDQSPALYVKDHPDKQWKKSFFYIAYGRHEREHYRHEADQLVADLQAVGVPCVLKSTPGKHSWDQWREQLSDALEVVTARTLYEQPIPAGKN